MSEQSLINLVDNDSIKTRYSFYILMHTILVSKRPSLIIHYTNFKFTIMVPFSSGCKHRKAYVCKSEATMPIACAGLEVYSLHLQMCILKQADNV